MKVVLQDGIKDCGICCLLSVVRYYGGEISKELLREMTNTNKAGVSAYSLVQAANNLGFKATGVMGDMSKIEKNNLPCLAHVIINKSYKHFVVIYDIDLENKKVLIMDPAKGKRVLTIGEFKLMSSSKYIFLKPLKKLPIIKHKNIIKNIMLEFIKNEKIFLILIFILSIVYFVFQIITSFHFKYFLKFAVLLNFTKPILFLSFLLLFIYFFKELAGYFRNILLLKCSNIVDSLITFKIYRHILLLPYLYYKNRTTGEVISRLKDLNLIKSFLVEVSCFLIIDFISIIVFAFLFYKLNKKLAIYIFLFSIIQFIIQIVLNKISKRTLKSISFSNDKVNSYLIESFSNIDVLKNSHLEKRIFDIFSLKYQKLLDSNYKLSVLLEFFTLIKNIINDFFFLIIFGLGSYLVINNELSLGNLIVCQSILNYFLSSFNNLLKISNNFCGFKLAYDRIEDIFTINREKFEGSYYYSFCRLDGIISFKNLNYVSYNKELFTNLSFSIFPGERVLLTGESGSGKSTLMKILMRYFEVPFGYVSIKNIDINHYHLEVLRKNIVYVSNLEGLFTDTIYNNIVLGRNISEEEFSKITKITGVVELINNDLGYDQLLEENGNNFSAGERQRIILARALVRQSDIYIFDEAFSQIDIIKTKKIMRKIFNYLEGKTIIVISHRFSEQKMFNRIFKLEDGKICEVKKL